MRQLAFALLLMATPAMAQDNSLADTQLRDPAREAQAKALMETIRCVECQGQSIADSNADMAGDMRALVRKRIAAGEDPESIRHWLVERYGDWVTYEPPLSLRTGPLWALPILLLGAGLVLARGRFKRKAKS